MLNKRRSGVTIAILLAIGFPARAADEDAVIKRATVLLEEISSMRESGIPEHFLHEARGITIVPHMVETQLGVGRKKGQGVYLHRDEKGEWGVPELVNMETLSVGAEAGREVTDLVILYRTQKAAEKDAKHSFAIGANFNFYYRLPRHSRKFNGPREDSKPEKEVLTYTRKRGMVVGVRLIGEYRSRTAPASGTQEAAGQAKSAEVGTKAAKTDQPVQETEPGGVLPEAARLKAALVALTAPPAAEVAEKGVKDPKVRAASGAGPSAETGSSPR